MVTNFIVIISFIIFAALVNQWFTKMVEERSRKVEAQLEELKKICK